MMMPESKDYRGQCIAK